MLQYIKGRKTCNVHSMGCAQGQFLNLGKVDKDVSVLRDQTLTAEKVRTSEACGAGPVRGKWVTKGELSPQTASDMLPVH